VRVAREGTGHALPAAPKPCEGGWGRRSQPTVDEGTEPQQPLPPPDRSPANGSASEIKSKPRLSLRGVTP
jgi:hypothetical protein